MDPINSNISASCTSAEKNREITNLRLQIKTSKRICTKRELGRERVQRICECLFVVHVGVASVGASAEPRLGAEQRDERVVPHYFGEQQPEAGRQDANHHADPAQLEAPAVGEDSRVVVLGRDVAHRLWQTAALFVLPLEVHYHQSEHGERC